MKVCITGQGHMTKMAAMEIAKFKNLLLQNQKACDFETWYLGMELYKVYINHDPGMTLTFLRQGQLRLPTHLNGENCYNVI